MTIGIKDVKIGYYDKSGSFVETSVLYQNDILVMKTEFTEQIQGSLFAFYHMIHVEGQYFVMFASPYDCNEATSCFASNAVCSKELCCVDVGNAAIYTGCSLPSLTNKTEHSFTEYDFSQLPPGSYKAGIFLVEISQNIEDIIDTGSANFELKEGNRSEEKGGCFIATAIYGNNHMNTNILRAFRDNTLLKFPLTERLVNLYYKTSPLILRIIERNKKVRTLAKRLLDSVVHLLKNKYKYLNK